MKLEDMHCSDCGNLGEKVACNDCAEGFGWKCKADRHGQHVHKDMAACRDFKDKTGLLESDAAIEYMGQIGCDVHNNDTTLSDLKVLHKLLEKYIENWEE